MARSLKKGPFVDAKLELKVETMNGSGKKKSDQNMVASFDGNSRFCGAYFRCS